LIGQYAWHLLIVAYRSVPFVCTSSTAELIHAYRVVVRKITAQRGYRKPEDHRLFAQTEPYIPKISELVAKYSSYLALAPDNTETAERKWTWIWKRLNLPSGTKITTHSLRHVWNQRVCDKFFRWVMGDLSFLSNGVNNR
jgi:hypothetical protein